MNKAHTSTSTIATLPAATVSLEVSVPAGTSLGMEPLSVSEIMAVAGGPECEAGLGIFPPA